MVSIIELLLIIEKCSELCAIIGFWRTEVTHFGNSVTEMYQTQEDYKPQRAPNMLPKCSQYVPKMLPSPFFFSLAI